MYRRNPTDVRLINSLKVFDKLPPDEREGLRLALIEIVFNSIGIYHYDQNATSDELLEEYGADERLTGKSVIDGAVPWLAQQLSKERFQSQREADALLDTLRRRFRALCTWATETRQNLSGMSIRQALEESQGYQSFAQRKGKLESDVNPTLYRFADGWKVVELRTEKALEREGDLMDHCLRTSPSEYFEKVESGESRIFSLRDPANKPHVTMEYQPDEERFEQIFGPSNEKPEEYTRPYLREFLEEMFGGNPAALLRASKLAGVPAKELDLQGADLRKADFEEVDLRGVDLRDADLRGAFLRFAKLQKADLREAKLEEANFEGAQLQGADLRDAKLQGVFCWDANLYRTKLQGANLQGADLRSVKNLKYAYLEDANLCKADLRGADLQGVKNLGRLLLEGAIYNDETVWPTGFDPRAAGAYLIAPKSDLRGAHLRGANLLNEELQGAKLQGAKLQRADLRGTDLRFADLQNANLQGAKLQRANLRGADLQAVKYVQDAELEGAFYNDYTMWPDDFDPEAAGAIYQPGED